MRTGTACVALAAVVALAGCADPPSVASGKAEMGTAVRAAASAVGVHATGLSYALRPRCGPDDAALDGSTLEVRAPSVRAADRRAALDRMAEALLDHGLNVERPAEGGPLLRAFPDGRDWQVVVTGGSGADDLTVSASGVVDDEHGLAGLELITACG